MHEAHVARTQFGQIMDRATQHHDRFIVARRGEPAVAIMGVEDFIRTTSPPPDWLQTPGTARNGAGWTG